MMKLAKSRLDQATRQVIGVRKLHRTANSLGKPIPTVELVCAGGCGARQRIRADKIKTGVAFICNNKKTRALCSLSIPFTHEGKVREELLQQAGAFTGVSYKDQGTASYYLHRIFETAFAVPLVDLARWARKRAKAKAKAKGND